MEKNKLLIMYVGPLMSGGTCRQRMTAMQDLGHEIIPIDTVPENIRMQKTKFTYRIIQKILGPLDFAGANQNILQYIMKKKVDILWIDRGITIDRDTLLEVKRISPNTRIANYNPDDPFGTWKHNRFVGWWKKFLCAIPAYDVHFVPRKITLQEYKNLGATNVVFFFKSYDPEIHCPMDVTTEVRNKFGGAVGFVGQYEKERARSMLYLAKNGIPVRIWGSTWGHFKGVHPNLKIENIPLWDSHYAKALCSFDIVLGFLSKRARDKQTSRSFEIPACGAFMLAEKTDEHLELFNEGREAEFFSTDEELLEKVKYYLQHEYERKKIAAGGRKRCLASGYNNRERMKQLLELV